MAGSGNKGFKTEEERRDKNISWQKSGEDCTKNNHDQYVAVSELREKFPVPYRDEEKLISLVESLISLVAHICVDSGNSMCTHGSGLVQRVRKVHEPDCPDVHCKGTLPHVYGVVTITTVLHVVATENAARKSKIQLNYDEDGNPNLKTLQGFKLLDSDKDTDELDWCAIECYTHDMNLIDELQSQIDRYENLQAEVYDKYKENVNKLVVVVGHPHGGPKRVSFGETLVQKQILKEVREQQEWCRYYHTAATCPGSSGSPLYILGQPLCGYGYWFGHPHNHSAYEEDDHRARSSIGVDHILKS